MQRKTRSVSVEVDVDVDVCTFTPEEVQDIRRSAEKILRVCSLYEEPFDRKALKEQAQYILNSLGDLR